MRALADIGCTELPLLAGLIEACEKSPPLFISRDVEEELHNLRSISIQVSLECVDVLVAVAPELSVAIVGGKALPSEPFRVNAQCDDLFVMRPVEDAYPATGGDRVRDAP